MKKIFLAAVAIAASMYAGGVSASAQSLKDLLGSTVKDAVETAITGGAVTPQKISGTWAYSGCAVGFESENMLKNVAAKAAASQLEGKVNTYLEKIGLKNGTFSYTFNADNTFSTTFKGKSFDGTYEISEDGSRITMKYGKSLKLMSIPPTEAGPPTGRQNWRTRQSRESTLRPLRSKRPSHSLTGQTQAS